MYSESSSAQESSSVRGLDWSRRIPELDGLRGIAILLVLLRHSVFGVETSSRWLAPLLAAGRLSWTGVDLFFVLSGFLIGGILLDARASPNYFQTFYLRRAYRILPLYAVFTSLFLFRHLVSAALPGVVGQVSPLSIPWFAYFSLTQNVWMAALGWYGPPAMMATWSLAVEEQFYLTIPLLIRRLPRKSLVIFLIAVMLGAPFLREIARHWLRNGDFACYVLTPCRADALCWGVICALVVRSREALSFLKIRRNILGGTVILFFAGMAFMTWRGFEQLSSPMNVWGYSWIAAFYTACLLTALSQPAPWIKRVLCSPALMSLGTIAYGTYLLHMPLIEAARQWTPQWLPQSPALAYLAGGVAGVVSAVGIAALSWKVFEKPLVRRGHRYSYGGESRASSAISGSVPNLPASIDFV